MLEIAEDRLLDSQEVATILNVKRRWVEEHTRLGEIPHVRLGRYVRYRREALRDWLEDREDLALQAT